MEPITLLILGIAAFAIIYILIKIAKFIIRLVFAVVIIAVLYFVLMKADLNQVENLSLDTVFDNKSIAEMKETLCEDEGQSVRCDCIVKPVYEDLVSRLSVEEINEVDKIQERVREEIKISLGNKSSEIRDCLLKEKGSEYLDNFDSFVSKMIEGAVD